MTSFKLGVMNYFAVKRWPEPEAWAEIIGVELDLNVVQFCFDLLDPRSNKDALSEMTDRISDSTKRYGLSISSCINGFVGYSQNLLLHPLESMRSDSFDWWSKAIILTYKLGAKTCGGFLGAYSSKDLKNYKKRKNLEAKVIENLSRLTDLGSTLNQKSFIWEAMPVSNEIPATMSDVRRLMEKANAKSKIPVRLLMDVGHAYGPGVPNHEKDVYKWLTKFAPMSFCIHLQQTDQIGDRHWPFTEKYNSIGLISGEKVVKAIESSGVKDCLLILEIVHSFVESDNKVIEDLKVSVKYWKEILGL